MFRPKTLEINEKKTKSSLLHNKALVSRICHFIYLTLNYNFILRNQNAVTRIKNWSFSTTLFYSHANLTLAFSSHSARIQIIPFWVTFQFQSDYLLFSFHFTLTQQLNGFMAMICNKTEIHWISLIVHSQAEKTSELNSCFLGRKWLNFNLHDFFLQSLPWQKLFSVWKQITM